MKLLRIAAILAITCFATFARADEKAGPPATPESAKVTEAPAPTQTTQTAQVDAAQDTVVIEYIEADIQNVLRTLAAKAGVNLILGDEVTGKVTLHLEGVSYEDAMKLITENKGYAYIKDKNVVRVKSRDALATEPVQLHVQTLDYAKAEDVKKTLEPVLTSQGKIQVNARSNTLVISDTPSSLAKLVPLIQSLDTQTPQVMIEAKFVETTRNPKKDLGVDWTSTVLGHAVTFSGQTQPVGSAGTLSGGGNFGLFKGVGAPTITPWLMSAAFLDVGQAKAVLSYLARDTDTELLANPRVVTTDNGKAKISIATQYPIPNFTFSEQTASLQISGFEYKDIGIILNVTPRINKNNFVTLEVTPEASSSTENATLQSGGGSAVQIPIINTRTATTTVLIKSGNTLAIGGLMRQDVSDSYTKVPLLGDLPGLGAMFRSKTLTKTKRDLLIFLTPTIVNPDGQTGNEQFYGGIPQTEVYTNDKWMPKDNAKPHQFIKGSSKGQ